MTTGTLGESQAYLANIVLGAGAQSSGAAIGVSALVQDSKSILVQYSVPVSSSALAARAYTLFPVDAGAFVPTFSVVGFADAANSSVLLRFDQSLTYGANYTLSVAQVASADGTVVADAAYNFVATVPDPPRILGAYISGTKSIDIVFDREVAQFTTSPGAYIYNTFNHHGQTLTPVPYSVGLYPTTNLRFSLNTLSVAGPYQIEVLPAQDVSGNSSLDATVPLTETLRLAPSATYPDIAQFQIVDAFVDHVSTGYLNRGYINVYLNSPVFPPDVADLSKWSVSQSGAHLTFDSADISLASDPTDLPSLESALVAFQTLYNGHLAYPGVHVSPGNALPDEVDLILLTNSLVRSFALHASTLNASGGGSVHLSVVPYVGPDGTGAVRPVRTLQDSIILLNLVRDQFNAHRVDSAVHANVDFAYAVLNGPATDFRSAVLLADELRIKLQMHVTSSYWHSVPDPGNVPSHGFIYGPSVYEAPTNLLTCAGMVNELQAKYLRHISDGSIHTYPDNINTYTASALALSQSDSVTGNVQPVIDTFVQLKTFYNAHLSPSYPTPIYSIRNFAKDGQPVSDPYSYLCVLEVKVDSFIPTFTVQTSARNSSLTSQASPGLYSGQTIVRSLTEPPKVLSSTSLPGGRILIRFDKQVRAVRPDLFTVREMPPPPDPFERSTKPFFFVPQFPRTVRSVTPTASVHCMNLLLDDLLTNYQLHLQLAGHKALDSADGVSASDYPAGDLGSLILSLNNLKGRFNSHASSSAYHQVGSTGVVTAPNAADLPGAYTLLLALLAAFQEHNTDLVLHTAPGPSTISARTSDEILVDLGDCTDGTYYGLSFSSQDRIVSLSGTAPSHVADFDVRFFGVASSPYLASATARSGLSARPDGMLSLGSDSVILYFSKPMSQSDPAGNVVFSRLPVKSMKWVAPNALEVSVGGMSAAGYDVSAYGLTDTVGNPVGYNSPDLPGLTFNTNAFGTLARPSVLGDMMYGSQYLLQNPSTKWVALQSNMLGATTSAYLLVADLNGNILYGQSSTSTGFLEVDIPALPAGTYIVEFGSDQLGLSFALDAYHDCSPSLSVGGGTLYDVIGYGCPSYSFPFSNASTPQFTATGASTTVTWATSPSVELDVVVHTGTLGGAAAGSGSGASGTLVVTTTPGTVYVIELAASTLDGMVFYNISAT